MTEDQLLETVSRHLADALGKIHGGDSAGARDNLMKAFGVFIKEEEFARAHGDLFDRTIGLSAVCLELAPTEEAMTLLSGAIKLRLGMIRSSSH